MKQERITFQTADQVTIAADWVDPAGSTAGAAAAGKKAALLLHMMPATRQSFAPLQSALYDAGVASLAIDLRGHGESASQQTFGKPAITLDYKKFSDSEHQASRLDVDAALNFLKSKGFEEKSIVIAGASIGANLAIDLMGRYKGISRGVALSPGLDFRGVKTESAVRSLGAQQKIWLIAAENDSYSAESVATLQRLKKETVTITIFAGGDHGTNLFASQKSLVADIIKFLLSA